MKKIQIKKSWLFFFLTLPIIAVAAAAVFFLPDLWGTSAWKAPRKIAGYAARALLPQVGSDAKGNKRVVWKEFDDATKTSAIWTTYSLAARNSWRIAKQLAPESLDEISGPQIFVAPQGDAIVVWKHTSSNIQTTQNIQRSEILASRYEHANDRWSPPQAISASAFDVTPPHIGGDRNGNVIVVWNQMQTSDANQSVWAIHFVASQNKWSQPAQISTAGANTAASQLAVTPGGDSIVVWQQKNAAGADNIHDILSRRYLAKPAHWEAEKKVSDGLRQTRDPQVTMADTGYALVAWVQQSSIDRSSAIWINRYQPDKGWDVIKKISNDSTGTLEPPSIGIDRQNNALAIWSQNGAIWANRYIANQTWERTQLISNNSESVEAVNPQLAFDKKDHAIAIWIQSTKPRATVFTSRFENNQWGANQQISEGSEDAEACRLIVNDKNIPIAVWQERGSSANAVWVSLYEAL